MIGKKTLINGAFGALLAVGGLAAMSSTASAYVVCNRDGDCWHTDFRYRFPGVGYRYHPDDWYFHRSWIDNDREHWREYHPGQFRFWRGHHPRVRTARLPICRENGVLIEAHRGLPGSPRRDLDMRE